MLVVSGSPLTLKSVNTGVTVILYSLDGEESSTTNDGSFFVKVRLKVVLVNEMM